jgi:subtilisin family serine protease
MLRFKIIKIALVVVIALPFCNARGEEVPVFSLPKNRPSGDEITARETMLAKLGSELAELNYEYLSYLESIERPKKEFSPSNKQLRVTDEMVLIDAVASGDVGVLKSDLEQLGMQNVGVFGRVVSGQLPIIAINNLADLDSLQFARPSLFTTHAGVCVSQGDEAIQSNVVRSSLGIDGSGTTVGTLSDSFNCLGGAEQGVADGYLPPGIVVLEEGNCDMESDDMGTDEGRAMMEIIYDVAPGASQVFHTADFGQANFAQGIMDLGAFGADVIVDDIIYFAEPMFQDGIIAQAVDTVVDSGVSYFSSAGNEARDSYENQFIPSDFLVIINDRVCEAHDFDLGPAIDIYQSITIPEGSGFTMSFQWDSPYFTVSGPPGSSNDLDILLLDSSATVALAGGVDNNIGGDPVEVFDFSNPEGSGQSDFNLLIAKCVGPYPGLIKNVFFDFSGQINEYGTNSSTIYGHANSSGGEAVGAAYYAETPEFGVSPALLEFFSSAGGTPILFDTSGDKLQTPIIRMNPEVVGPDGVNTSFFGVDSPGNECPSFSGTSAAAPHAAGVATLMLEVQPTLSPGELYGLMEITALEMGPRNGRTVTDDSAASENFNFDSGFGFIQADLAVQQLVVNIDVAPTEIDFGVVNEGASVKREFTISNASLGSELLTVNNIEIIGSDASKFKQDATTPFTLEPGESKVVTVKFRPGSARAFIANLLVESNDPNEGTVVVVLSGQGKSSGGGCSIGGSSNRESGIVNMVIMILPVMLPLISFIIRRKNTRRVVA